MPSHVSAPMPSHVSAPMPSHVFAPMPSHVCAPMPSHVCAPMPSHVSAPMPSHVSAPMPSHVFAPMPSHVFAPMPSHVYAPMPSHVSVPTPSHVFSTMPSHVFAPMPCVQLRRFTLVTLCPFQHLLSHSGKSQAAPPLIFNYLTLSKYMCGISAKDLCNPAFHASSSTLHQRPVLEILSVYITQSTCVYTSIKSMHTSHRAPVCTHH